MIVTTTNNIDGQQVAQYLRVVSGEVIVGANFFKDIAAGFRNIVGGAGRAGSHRGQTGLPKHWRGRRHAHGCRNRYRRDFSLEGIA